ncbi:MAG: hypothetical protein GAK40_00725 [Burkholderia plantarii]|nr:MAG: hypothetical protein GAK40_00725 [Burkholderia plantarii]
MTFYRFDTRLFGELDRLQRRLSGRPASSASATFTAGSRGVRFDAFPPINVGSSDEAIEIVAFAPGMQAGDFDVCVDKGLLTITGERRAPLPEAGATATSAASADGARTLARERFSGRFRRAVELPSNADTGRIEARYDDGCLRIRIARQPASQPRSIEIQ